MESSRGRKCAGENARGGEQRNPEFCLHTFERRKVCFFICFILFVCDAFVSNGRFCRPFFSENGTKSANVVYSFLLQISGFFLFPLLRLFIPLLERTPDPFTTTIRNKCITYEENETNEKTHFSSLKRVQTKLGISLFSPSRIFSRAFSPSRTFHG